MASITLDLFPEVWRSYFYTALCATIGMCMILTVAFADVDYSDNLVINNYGINSICLFMDYPPATYFAPGCYCLTFVFIVVYAGAMFTRIHLFYLDGLQTKCEYYTLAAVTLVELGSWIVFATIFAVNDESIIIHSWCYFQLIWASMAGSIRNLYVMLNLPNHLKDWEKNAGIIYVVLYLFFGLWYLIGMITLLYGNKMLQRTHGVVDRVFTALLLGQALISFVVQAREVAWIEVTLTLKYPEDVKGAEAGVSYHAVEDGKAVMGKKADREITPLVKKH